MAMLRVAEPPLTALDKALTVWLLPRFAFETLPGAALTANGPEPTVPPAVVVRVPAVIVVPPLYVLFPPRMSVPPPVKIIA